MPPHASAMLDTPGQDISGRSQPAAPSRGDEARLQPPATGEVQGPHATNVSTTVS